MRAVPAVIVLASLVACATPATTHAADVPKSCTPEVNARLADLIAHDEQRPVDNVVLCGVTIGPSRPQRRGPHGGHEIIPLRAPLPNGTIALVEVVTNDDLDGRVTAPRGATVFAYGQYFHPSYRQRPFVAGIHDVHCATHRGADNGYVVVNGVRYPRGGC